MWFYIGSRSWRRRLSALRYFIVIDPGGYAVGMISQRIFPAYEPQNADFEALVRQSIAMQPMMKMIGATMETVAPGAVTIRLPFDNRLTQQNGYLHAGAVTSVLDS